MLYTMNCKLVDSIYLYCTLVESPGIPGPSGLETNPGGSLCSIVQSRDPEDAWSSRKRPCSVRVRAPLKAEEQRGSSESGEGRRGEHARGLLVVPGVRDFFVEQA